MSIENASFVLIDPKIFGLSGHKNTDSLKSYHQASIEIQKDMSNILTSENNTPKSNEKQQQVLQERSFLPPANHQYQSSAFPVAFQGAMIKDCTFNIIYQNNSASVINSPVKKRKRIIVVDDF